jgi:hypothetical protein
MARRGQHGAFAAGGNYKPSINGYGGGNKLSGTGYSGIGMRATIGKEIRTDAVPTPAMRNTIFTINQLGGVGAGRSIFAASGFPSTGSVKKVAPFQFEFRRRS